MSDLRELYQQLILDHNKNPRNFRVLDPADRFAEGYNPLCGDKVEVYLQLQGDRIKDIGFQGSGCAISKASASLMTETIKGKTLAKRKPISKTFKRCSPTQPAISTSTLWANYSFLPACATIPPVSNARPYRGTRFGQP